MLRKNRRQTFLLQTNTCPRFLFTTSCEWFLLAASGHLHTSRLPRHVENTAQQSPYHTLLVIASRAECTARQSHRPRLVRESCHCEPQRGEAISLQVARNLIANRSPHYVRDDNLFLHLPATCHCDGT